MSQKEKKHWKQHLFEVIYEADTKEGKLFDVVLLWVILISIVLVMLESVKSLDAKYHNIFYFLEWIITILFSFEYIARVISVRNPKKYIFSFYGIIDLLSTIPMYLSFVFAGSHALIALRALRLLRVFRILKLVRFVGEANKLRMALRASRFKILVFLLAVVVLCIILGTVMYLVEGDASGFTSIPRSVYWAVVTLTTVGYGDIHPVTALGQFIASMVMILGYAIIAIPTGIVTSEYTRQTKHQTVNLNTQTCPNCSASHHRDGAQYCYNCGEKL